MSHIFKSIFVATSVAALLSGCAATDAVPHRDDAVKGVDELAFAAGMAPDADAAARSRALDEDGIPGGAQGRTIIYKSNFLRKIKNIATSVHIVKTNDANGVDQHLFTSWLNYMPEQNRWGFFDNVADNKEDVRRVKLFPADAYYGNFYAVANIDANGLTNAATNAARCLEGKTFHYNRTPQAEDISFNPTDLLYANKSASFEEIKTDSVHLEFKHAMACLEFDFENQDPNIRVEVENVRLFNVKSSGDLNLTDGSWDLSDAVVLNTDYGGGYMMMKIINLNGTSGTQPETAMFCSATTGYDQTDIQLSTVPLHYFVIPQTLEKWAPKAEDMNASPTSENGKPFIALWTRLTNISDPANVYTIMDFGWILLPVTTDTDVSTGQNRWQAGKKHRYHIVFGKGAGGWFNDGSPSLVPITIDGITVKPFTAYNNGTPIECPTE